MKFTHEYSKLKNDEFTTIRKNSGYYKKGDITSIETPNSKFRAGIIDDIPIKKRDITEIIAWKDADCKRKELIKMLEKWYGKKYDDYVLLYLKKIQEVK